VLPRCRPDPIQCCLDVALIRLDVALVYIKNLVNIGLCILNFSKQVMPQIIVNDLWIIFLNGSLLVWITNPGPGLRQQKLNPLF